MFIYVKIQSWIKAFISHNTLSGGHVGGLLWNRQVVFMKVLLRALVRELMSMLKSGAQLLGGNMPV